MFARRYFVIVLLLLAALALVACGAANVEPGAGDPATDTPEAEQVAEEALGPARDALADFLGVEADALELEKIEDAEWPDGCLGLGGPAESCLAAITPGYAITFNVDGESYVVRTDLEGIAARVEAAAEQGPEGDAPAAAVAALQQLAAELGVSAEEIEIISWTAQEWSDSCLGLGGPAESCAQVITPGYVVALSVGDEIFTVRTDETGSAVRVAGPESQRPGEEAPAPGMGDAVLYYERSGGFAGELLTVYVYEDGTVERQGRLNAPGDGTESFSVEPSAVEQLIDDLREAGFFELERSYLPADPCCDRFMYVVRVRADGEVQSVETVTDTESAPDALWESLEIINAFIEEATAAADQ